MKISSKEKSTIVQQKNFAIKTETSLSEDMFQHLVTQTILTIPKPYRDTVEKLEKKKRTTIAILKDIQPHDTMEGMLAAQMIAVNDMAMHCLATADGLGSCSPHTQNWLIQANKLIRT